MAINPSLFAALGRGFQADAYAIDGNHLRWQFDPRLGYPRHAFCVELRPSVHGREAAANLTRRVDLRAPAGTTGGTRTVLSLDGLEVTRPGGSFQQTSQGIALSGEPLVVRFVGNDAHACWVSLRLVLRSPGGAVVAAARYHNRGQAAVVDRASRSLRRRPPGGGPLTDLEGLHDLLARPAAAKLRPTLTDRELERLHRRLVAIDPRRFTRVTTAWLGQLLDLLKRLGVAVDDLGPDLSVRVVVDLVLDAARIDDLALTGALADVQAVTWVPTEDLMAAEGWKPLGCFPAAAREPDYVDRNADQLAGVDIDELAKDRVLGGGPVGVEPLDEPVVPPTRPATDEEKARRYLEPWRDRLEPWLAQVLAASLGGGLHQSEVTVTEELEDAGQSRGQGIPDRLTGRPPTVTVEPYAALIAVGLAGFPTARLLGLGCVDTKPAAEPLDYRVRGRWLVEDLWAWVGAIQRRLKALLDRLEAASPFSFGTLQEDVLTAQLELAETVAFVEGLTDGAVEGVVELWALVIGVQPATRPLFAPPTAVTVAPDGLGLPPDHAHQAAAAVRWTLRQRARVVADEEVPTGACIARTADAVAPFDDVRNPNDPADDTTPPVAVLPAGPADEPGTAGEAEFVDRYVDDGVTYRYGVSECDPFGRWSPFVETEFRWDDPTPPPAPAEVGADLEETGTPTAQVLTTTFGWPVDLAPLAGLTFELHYRRDPPPSASPVDPAAWGRFERVAGTAAGPLTFAAGFEGATAHDGITVLISAVDELRPSPTGTQQHRVITVAATGVVVSYDAADRAQAWVAVRARNAKGIPSARLGGPAKAEDFRIAPPPPPQFPPEPLVATFPDADGRSSFTLQLGGPQRAVVYRAGERELAAMAAQRGLASGYDPEDPPAQRSGALRAVAPQLRDAFQPVSELLGGDVPAFTDELGGGLQTLTFYTVVRHSPALVPGPWPPAPDGFVAVAVPKIPTPAVPLVVRAAWTATPSPGVELLVGEPVPGTAAVSAFEVYRTLEATAERAADWRRMRPSGRFPVTGGGFEDRGLPPRVLRILDDDAVLPWAAYLSRVVGRGPEGGLATRSEPSAVARVVTASADPPAPPPEVSAAPIAGGLTVRWKAAAPSGPAGRFRFEVIDPLLQVTLARLDADDARDPSDPAVFRLDIDTTTVPDDVAVVLIDPFGRRATSDQAAVV